MSVTGERSTWLSEAPLQGIDKRIADAVDAVLIGSSGPKSARTTLLMKFAEDPEMLALVPAESQLKSRKQILVAKKAGKKLSTYADVLMWAADKKCFTRDDFFGAMGTPQTFDPEEDARLFEQQTFAFKNDLIVLSAFRYPVENEKPTLGIVVTSRRVFRNAVLAFEGQPSGIVGVTDGTYRLHRGGWVVVDFGTCCTLYTRNTYAQCFIPFAYLFVRTENIACYKMFFHVVQQGVLDFFGLHLNLNVGSLDHSDSFKAAFLQKWPDIVLTSCWPHVLRGSYKAEKLGKLICREMYKKRIRPHLDMLHSCRTIKQFQAVADMVITDWKTHGEFEYAAWFEEEYLTDPWRRWFATATNLPGVMPNQNHIEAHHRSIKVSAIISKRASTAVVLNVSLPRILVQAGELGGLSDKLRPYCSGPVAGEVISRAEVLCTEANHMVNYSKNRGRAPLEFFFNSRAQMVHSGNKVGIPVDEGRVKTYKASLREWINKNVTLADVSRECLGLHRVQIKNQLNVAGTFDQCTWALETVESIHAKFNCDCISFYSSGWLCAHILASLELLQNIGISQMLDELEPRKLPGRPPKKARSNPGGDGAPKEYSVGKRVRLALQV